MIHRGGGYGDGLFQWFISGFMVVGCWRMGEVEYARVLLCWWFSPRWFIVSNISCSNIWVVACGSRIKSSRVY